MAFPKAALVLLLILSVLPLSSALSAAGGPCNYTGQCSEGYCLDNACKLPPVISSRPISECTKTADCSEGYCSTGTCIIPTVKAEILNIGIKSGCSGLAEETSVFGSFILCEAMWVLVPVFALAAAYISARGGNNRFVTAAVLLLPIFISLIFFAFLGIIFALVEIAAVLARKKYA
ncbi:MAG: hypothetical protein WC759_00705 [Candidatus Micrarchaeia archaeon]|jgi:hypothetical protein